MNELIVTGRIIEITARNITIKSRTGLLKVFLPTYNPLRGHHYGDMITISGKLYTSNLGFYPIVRRARIIDSIEETMMYEKMQKIEKIKLIKLYKNSLIDKLKSGEIVFKSVLDNTKKGNKLKLKHKKRNK